MKTPSLLSKFWAKINFVRLEAAACNNRNMVFEYLSSAPLHFAAGHGHLDIVMKLIEFNADVNIELDSGETAYDIAVSAGNTEVADYLENLL